MPFEVKGQRNVYIWDFSARLFSPSNSVVPPTRVYGGSFLCIFFGFLFWWDVLCLFVLFVLRGNGFLLLLCVFFLRCFFFFLLLFRGLPVHCFLWLVFNVGTRSEPV